MTMCCQRIDDLFFKTWPTVPFLWLIWVYVSDGNISGRDEVASAYFAFGDKRAFSLPTRNDIFFSPDCLDCLVYYATFDTHSIVLAVFLFITDRRLKKYFLLKKTITFFYRYPDICLCKIDSTLIQY